MMLHRYSWQSLTFFSLAGFAMAIVCFTHMNPRAGIANESELLQARGKVAWIQEFKYGTRFGLVGVPERFDYPSKANGMGAVRDSLKYAGDKTILVRYESKTHGPIYSDDLYHNVWELIVGGQVIRSYAESASAWESDNRVTPWLGAAMTLCGVILGFAAWKTRRAAQRGARADGPAPGGSAA